MLVSAAPIFSDVFNPKVQVAVGARRIEKEVTKYPRISICFVSCQQLISALHEARSRVLSRLGRHGFNLP